MRPDLQAIASTQYGVFLRHQAKSCGYTDPELKTLIREHGEWIVVRRGAYAVRSYYEGAPREHQLRMRDVAASLTMTTDHVLSHDSAARLLGLDMLRVKRPYTHVTRIGVGGSRLEHGVKHHLDAWLPAHFEHHGPFLVTPLSRTAVDIAREHGLVAGTVACDAALRRGVTREELQREVLRMAYWPHVTRARAAVAAAEPGAESVGETLARLLVIDLGFGRPTTQFPVRIDDTTVWADMIVGRHIFEFDGRVKYTGELGNGSGNDVLRREKLRQDRLMGLGLGVSRIVWDDCVGPGRAAAIARLRTEVRRTFALFGNVVPPEMTEYAARVRPSRVGPDVRRTG